MYVIFLQIIALGWTTEWVQLLGLWDTDKLKGPVAFKLLWSTGGDEKAS